MLKLPTDPQYQSSSSWCIANIVIRASVEVGVVGVVAEVVLEVVLVVVVGANVAGTTGARSQQLPPWWLDSAMRQPIFNLKSI